MMRSQHVSVTSSATGSTVAVLGTGTMGQGIAQVAAVTGHATRLFDAAPERAKNALAAIGAQLDKLVTKGKTTQAARDDAMGRLAAVTSVGAACEGCDVVVEAV